MPHPSPVNRATVKPIITIRQPNIKSVQATVFRPEGSTKSRQSTAMAMMRALMGIPVIEVYSLAKAVRLEQHQPKGTTMVIMPARIRTALLGPEN